MSIFDCKTFRKVCLDDTHYLKATIINTETTQGHTEYIIRVKRDLNSGNSWLVSRRYNDFLSLHHALQPSGILLPFPPKKIIGNMNRNFIAERQIALQNYLDLILSHSILASQLVVKKFLDPHNYICYRELGSTIIAIGIRGDSDIKVSKQLPHIGTRIRKEYYLVTMKSDPKEDLLLTWLPFGPDTCHDQKQILVLLKTLSSLQHINIANLVKVGVCNGGAWTVKEIRKTGSLLDVLSGSNKSPWTEQGIKKYANYELRKPIPCDIIIDIVTQILQALAFLHYKGIPYGHLHNGNIVYHDGLVKLLDIENGSIGVPNLHRSILTRVKKLNSLQAVDVYCLGLAIYEMATAIPFSPTNIDFTGVPEKLRPIVESILSNEAAKTGLPTVADLLNIGMFRQSSSKPHPYIRLTASAKESFAECASQTIERIKNDYNKYRHEKRVSKVYEYLDETEGQVLVCYRKKSKHSTVDDDVNGNSAVDRSGSPSTNNSNTNTTPSSADSACVPVNFHSNVDSNRKALLGAICNFNKNSLRKINETPCI